MRGARDIVIEVRPGEVRAAALDNDGEPYVFEVERASAPRYRGAVCLGRVRAVRPELGAAFVDIGLPADGFLNLKDAGPANLVVDVLGTPLSEGAAIVVQVKRDAEAEKGPVLTIWPDLTGGHMVLTPGRAGIGLSKRIKDDQARHRLRDLLKPALPDDAGLVVRTRAEHADDAALLAEARGLAARWAAVEAGATDGKVPRFLIAAPTLAARMVLEHVDTATRRIVVDDTDAMAALKDFCAASAPSAVPMIVREGRLPAFAAAGIDDAFAAALGPEVRLPGGGVITITETPALTTVDVDARRARASRQDEVVLATNLEAATALGRAVRLRGIGGLIVVDFLKLNADRDREAVLAALKRAFADDPAETRATGFSAFGLVEIQRRRAGPSLAQLHFTRTLTPNPESTAIDALAALQRRGGTAAALRVPGDVAAVLRGPLAAARKDLARRLGFDIRIEAVSHGGVMDFEIVDR